MRTAFITQRVDIRMYIFYPYRKFVWSRFYLIHPDGTFSSDAEVAV